MIKDSITVKGYVSLVLTDSNGNIKEQHKDNLVVNSGLAHIISRLKDTTSAAMSYIAIGQGATVPSVSQTSLVSEIHRVSSVSTIVTTNIANDSLQYAASFGPGIANGVIREAGIFNDPTAGTMLSRVSFGDITKSAGDTLTITWKIVIS